MSDYSDEREMIATQKEMEDAKIDLAFRDHCAHMLIPLNKCRRATYYMPWQCNHERHAYEKCQYLEYKRRVDILHSRKQAE
mmetsp:Transcript_18079/g.29318  ORF Transcript_18079/g.29318 Transcript_18079/m.29318 type:complete len:81 (-) Transcript_18079:2209-2451(-)